MKERLINEIIVALREEQTTTKSISNFKERMSLIFDNYDIAEKSREVAIYTPIPKELEIYLVTKVIEGTAKSTAEQYKIVLSKFFLTIKKNIGEVETNDIRKYLYQYKKYYNVSDRYLDWIRIAISGFFRWLVNNKYLECNPSANVSPIKYVCNRREYLTQRELEEIRDNCKSIRERAIVEILYSTGMRCNELCNLKIEDLNIDSKTIKVYNQKGKRYKICYLNDKSIYWIMKYMKYRHEGEYLIQGIRRPYNKLSGRRLEKIIDEIVSRTSIRKKVSPSIFRHTTATQGLNNGMSLTEVQTILDHKSPTTTLIYAEKYNEDIQMSHRRSII